MDNIPVMVVEDDDELRDLLEDGLGEMTPEQPLEAAAKVGAHRILAKPLTVYQMATILHKMKETQDTTGAMRHPV